MKVLITGGYGFIGSFVSERFKREGHEVIIVDNLSTGNVDYCQFNHNSFILDVESNIMEMIFQHHNIDIVVHLAAQINVVTSIENPYEDTKSNILGLMNLLQLAVKYRVRKFIFASSAAVYGIQDDVPLSEKHSCNPVSPYGINKLLGEYYCNKWNELYGLETLCLRFANVYGPRQGNVGEGGVISAFMERLRDQRSLVIFGNGKQTRDFIYVEDVAEGIYRASQSAASGVMNLSNNEEHSINQVLDLLSELAVIPSVIREAPRAADIFRSRLDNFELRQSLNWKPRFSLMEGLMRTYEWFKQERAEQYRVEDADTVSKDMFSEQFIHNELLASSLSRNIRSLYLQQEGHYLQGMPILKHDVFAAVLRSRRHAQEKFRTPYTLLQMDGQYKQESVLLQRIRSYLRETDYIGESDGGQMYVLLSNTKQEGAIQAIARLCKEGIPAGALWLHAEA